MKRLTLVWDALAVAGLALVAAGLWLFHPSWSLIVTGTAMIGIAIWGAKRCS